MGIVLHIVDLHYRECKYFPDFRYLHATFEPRAMSADELTEGCFRLHREFYSHSSVLRRALARKTSLHSLTHLAAFTAINLIGRREIANRHGHRLGADEPVRQRAAWQSAQ